MLRLNELITVIKMKEAIEEYPRGQYHTESVVLPKDHVTLRRHWEALLSDVQAAITHRVGKGLAGCAPALASCPPSALQYLERAAKAALAVEPKEQSAEIATLRAKVAELDVIVREFASTSHLLDLGEVAFVCPFCRTDLDGKLSGHDDDCVWLLARKTLGMDC